MRNELLKTLESKVDQKAVLAKAKLDRKAKLDSWGEDGRGPSFEKAMEAIKA